MLDFVIVWSTKGYLKLVFLLLFSLQLPCFTELHNSVTGMDIASNCLSVWDFHKNFVLNNGDT